MWDEALLFLVPFWCQIFDAFIVLRWATVAHMGLLLSDTLWGGSKAEQGVKESFKDKRLYLECCHSGSGFGQIFQGIDPGRAKIGRGRASPLTKSSFRPIVHSNILMYCWRPMHLFESCHSGCLFFWLNCLLLIIRWGIKCPWSSSYKYSDNKRSVQMKQIPS